MRLHTALGGLSSRRWGLLVGSVVVGALLVRLVVIALYQRGGSDLEIFYYFGNLMRSGDNPYDAPADGPIEPIHGNHPPFEFGATALLLAIHDSRNTLRVASAIVEAATVLVILAFAPRSRTWRIAVGSFVGFNPFTLIAWTAFFEDKGAMFFVLVVILIAIERASLSLTWLMSTVFAAVWWLVMFIPALAIQTHRRVGKQHVVTYSLAFVLIYAVSYVPFFPSNLELYSRRSERSGNQPDHASLLTLLSEAGIYDPLIARIAILVSLLLIYIAYLGRRIDIRETIVLSVLATFVFLPDHPTHRIALTTLPFLFILRLTPTRLALIWGGSLLAAWADVVARSGVPLLDETNPVAEATSALFGPEIGSLGYAFFGNSLTFLMLALFAKDKLAGRRADEPAAVIGTAVGHKQRIR